MRYLMLFVLVFGLFTLEPRLAVQRNPLEAEKPVKMTLSEFFLQFLGEFRYTLASYIWLNTEIYHHELGLTWIASTTGKGDPKKIGEILAICRIVTTLDPHFINAYDIGGWRLAKSLGNIQEGVAFLQQGLADNPGNILLNQDLGEIYFIYAKNYKNSIPYLEIASKGSADITQKSLNLHMLAYAYTKEKKFHQAIKVYHSILILNPQEKMLEYRIKELQRKHSKN